MARKPLPLRAHAAMVSTTIDWDEVGICDSCGFRQDHRVHDLDIDIEAAAEADARKLGEAIDGR